MIDMVGQKKLSVEEKLQIETLRRGANGAFAQILLAGAMFHFIPNFPQVILYKFICVLLILIFFLRWLVFKRFYKKPEKLIKTNPWNLYIGISTSFLWMLNALITINNFKVYSVAGLMHFIVAIALLASVMYSLAATPKLQKIYVIVLGLPIAFTIIFSEDHESFYFIGIALLLFIAYLLHASKSHSYDLRSAYEFEEKLLLQNTKLQEVVDSIPGFMIILSETGEWLQWSASTMSVLNNQRLKEEIEAFISSGADRKVMEMALVAAEETCFVITFEKLKSLAGQYIAIGLPITELKHMRDELEAQKQKASYSARLAAIGEMAGGVAHEINNPLSVISISSEFLSSKLQKAGIDEALWKKHTSQIFSTAKRISKIIKSLQKLTRKDVQMNVEVVDLDMIIREALDISTEKMKIKGIHISYTPIEHMFVKCRHVETGQAILNLINNAYEAIQGQGEIWIKASENKDEVSLEISDTGFGVPNNLTDKIFEPFFSTKAIGEGTGLGLSISRSILVEYGGDLELVSSKHPTTFRLKFKKAHTLE